MNVGRKEIIVSGNSQKSMAELICLACMFNSDIMFENSRQRINVKSLMGVMAFDFAEGMPVNIITAGNDEQEALFAIENFLVHK